MAAVRPPHELLQSDKPWNWWEHDGDFITCKQWLLGGTALVPPDTQNSLGPASDKLPCGVRIVILHVMEDGKERVAVFISMFLISREETYA